MSTSSNVVEEAADLLRARINDLDAERAKLERALASLTDGREGKRGPGRPRRGSARSSSGESTRRRRRSGGTRAEQAVKLISENPGIGASEIAKQLGIKPNYMYRVLTDLQKEGLVAKDGRAYTATGAPAADTASSSAPEMEMEPAQETSSQEPVGA
jgi:Fic family protein